MQLESDSGVTESGGVVSGWLDQSSSGNDLIAVGDPSVVSGELNGLPVLDFDGTEDRLERLSDLSGLPVGNADRTVFLLARYRGIGFGGFAYGDTSPNNAFGTIVDNNGGRLTVQGFGLENDLISDTLGTGAGWLVQSVVLDSGEVAHYLNSTQICLLYTSPSPRD